MSDSLPFDIIFFAMIAVFLVMKLRSVLGRRTGTEKPRDILPRSRVEEPSRDKVIPLPDRASAREPVEEPKPVSAEVLPPEPAAGDPASLAVRRALERIRGADPSFDPGHFLDGARAAFEMIVTAFAKGDLATLRPLLSDEVYDNFRGAIEARQKAGHTLETTLVGLTSSEIIEADLQGRVAILTVKFVSEQINATYDGERQVVEGDPSLVTSVTDIWSFARNTRSRDPNWTLVATRSPN
ncbi:MAG: Tim44 domain-containing protein [Rhodospirillaceae bacterium]|nr:Tim44 domain-containing protein [Rhodospirillaceae bacterium]